MTRPVIDYSAGGEARAGGFDPDTPIAGFYKMKLRSGAHPVGIHIWFGAPIDPVTGEELDRSHCWRSLANDRPIELERVWPRCAADQIDEREYRYLADLQAWAEQHAPESAQANPHRRVNPLTSLIPF